MSQRTIIAVSILGVVLCLFSSLSSAMVSVGGGETLSSTGPSTPGRTPTPTPTPTPAPAPARAPAPVSDSWRDHTPPTSLSFFTESCADLGGGSDIITAGSLEECASKCINESHGYSYICYGFIYGQNYDGQSPFCRVYNNKDLDHGTNICPSGIKSYTRNN